MNSKRRHLRRRLVQLLASVLPLFADDVVVPHDPMVMDDDDGGRRHATSDDDDEYSSLPQHLMDYRSQEYRQQHQEKYDQETYTSFRKFHRILERGNQQWVEQVWLPTQLFNGSTLIPFYPFSLGTDMIDTTMDSNSASLTWNTTNYSDSVNSGMNLNRTSDVSNEQPSVDSHTDRREENASILTTVNNATGTATSESDHPTKTTTIAPRVKHVEVDYASKSAGAVILDSSPNFQGVSNLLQQDRDKYAIVPCDGGGSSNSDTTITTEPKYVVIGLSEDILVKQFAIANYERYSSQMKEIRLFGSVSTNAIRQQSHWIHLGDFTAKPNTNTSEKQTFDLLEPTWARYLKVEFTSHYGDEYYCTISQISVHGSTVLQGFHEQWNEENNDEGAVDGTDTKSTTAADTISSRIEDTASTVYQVNATQEDYSTPLLGTKSSKINVDETTVPPDVDVKQIGDTSSGPAIVSLPSSHRYNFSRVTGCRSSLSFEENLIYHTSRNKNMSDVFENRTNALSTSLLSSRPSRSSFSTLCSTTTRTAITPKRPIRKVQVRHEPRTQETLTSVLPNQVAYPNIRTKQLSKLSLGLERVTDFLRNAIEGFNSSKMTKNDIHVQESSPSSTESDDSIIHNDAIHGAVTASDVSTSENVRVEDQAGVEDSLELNGLMIANVLKRLPSAKCLEKLNFSEYKSNLKAASSKP